jgi:hypothetical protein
MEFRLVEQDDEVVEFEVRAGNVSITFVANVRLENDTVVIATLHAEGQGPGSAGIPILRRAAWFLMEHFDVRELRG